jgi:hypothetical protein
MSLEATNNMRKLQGLEPLTELPKEGAASETKTPEEIEAARVAAEAKAKTENQNNSADTELSDEQLLKQLEKRGITAKSFEELKTPAVAPDPAKLAEQREADELAYGLSKGLFNKKEYDGFVADNSNSQNIVFAQYHAEAKAEDPELTDEEIQLEFESKYGLDAEPGTRKHKRGVKEINTIAESLLKQKYGKIYEAKSSFTGYEKQSQSEKADKIKLETGIPTYNKDIEEVFNSLKKIPVKFSDTESVEVDALQSGLDELKSMMLTPDIAKGKILSGYKKETLKEEVFAAFLYRNFPALAKEIANQHLLKHAAGTKGIPLLGGRGRKEEQDLVPNEAQKKLIELQKQHNPVAAN